MKTNLMPIKKILIALTIFCSISASAQKTGGNGGDPNEVANFVGRNGEVLDSWHLVRMDLINGILTDKYLELDLKGIDPIRFKKDMLRALRNTKVIWDNFKIIVDGTPRPCENFKTAQGVKIIHCNQTAYASTMRNYDAEAQYKMIAHEYLGAGGYEANRYHVSNYGLSSQISGALSSVTVKRWVVKPDGQPSTVSTCGPEYFKDIEIQNKILQFTETVKNHLNNSNLLKRNKVVISNMGTTLIKQEPKHGMHYLAIDNILLSNGVKINYTGHESTGESVTITELVVKRVLATKDDFGRTLTPAYCKPYLFHTLDYNSTITNEAGDIISYLTFDFNEQLALNLKFDL